MYLSFDVSNKTKRKKDEVLIILKHRFAAELMLSLVIFLPTLFCYAIMFWPFFSLIVLINFVLITKCVGLKQDVLTWDYI